MTFVHLHTHTEYSLLDGMSKIHDLVERAVMFEMPALAITDHGQLHGALEFYQTATDAGIKPIIGLEGYVARGSRHEKTSGEWPYHLTLLAQDLQGYRNLLKISSLSHLEGFYRRPRMDRELLERYSEGLIVLSGCPSGELLQRLREDDQQGAREVAGWYSDVFKGRYYLEVMEHGIDQFSQLTPKVADLARSLDLPLVHTHDSHYTSPEHAEPHDVLLCIGTNATVSETNRFRFGSDQFYLKSPEEMRGLLPAYPEAADNTLRLAETVNLELDFGRTQLPNAGVPEGLTAFEHLRELCEEGVERRYHPPTEEHRERLRYELMVIEQTGFAEYMLIVRDLARFARERSIPMAVRGSAAASIVLYTLDVTDIEPTTHGLVFERFLNPARISMPDVDFDFADDRREEVIRYAAERYGRDRVAQICTFGTMGAKAAIRDTGRALGLSFGETDRIARMVPDQLGVTIDSALRQSADLETVYQGEEQGRRLIDSARSLEGVARHASTHAAGVVISRDPLMDIVPLQRPTGVKDDDALPTTQFAMADVERIGLLKVDFLGLTNLTILGRAVELIREERGETVELTSIPDDDALTAEMLARAETFGVFQLESAGMRRYVGALKPRNITELAAMVALFRPGPMEHIPRYIDVKFGRAEAAYPHPDLANILDETYGVITYQDQVLQIARQFAGYSLGEADVMRKAMGKKIPAVMLEERERFLQGSVENGYQEETAAVLFDLIEPFAGYAFNKAHAVSYGTIAYQTAYLKAHYPVEYLTAVLIAAGGSQERLAAAIGECTRLGVEVLQPDINRSRVNFSIERGPGGEPAIRFGLAQIKNVGQGGVVSLLEQRESDGPFTSLENFARRVQPREMNKRVIVSLAKAGALDSLADRGSVIASADRLAALAQQQQKLRDTGQTSMFDLFGDEVDTPLAALELEVAETPRAQLLAWEKELLGTYVSEHPVGRAAADLAEYVTVQAAEINEAMTGEQQVIAGTVAAVRSLSTRQGKPFAAVTLEDASGQVEVTIWPDRYADFREIIRDGMVLLARVGVRSRNGRLTVAVEDLAPYDAERHELVGASLQSFRLGPRAPGARTASSGGERDLPAPDRPPPDPGPQGGMPGPLDDPTPLRPLEPPPTTASQSPSADERGWRLEIRIEETTDERADRRRLRHICGVLDRYPGDLPVELVICPTAERPVRYRRGAIDRGAGSRFIPEIRALLGVLGTAEERGVPAAASAGLASAR